LGVKTFQSKWLENKDETRCEDPHAIL